MKALTCALALLVSMPLAALQAQQPSPAMATATTTAKRTDIYHVFIAKAAPGKAKELEAWLKEPDPKNPHAKGILLRHQEGDAWDYVAIEYIGKSAKVEVGQPNTMTPQQRLLMEWHTDTFAAGPSWAEFAKQMGLDSGAASSADSVYIVSDYRAVPGQRDELEKSLSNPGPGDTTSGSVLLAHVEGGPWNFLGIQHYDSWDKFAEGEKNSMAQTKKGEGGWYELRQSCAFHHDTLTDRIMP